MGIDPGTNKMGYGIIQATDKRVAFVSMGYIDLSRFDDAYQKLKYIHERVSGLFEQYKPEEVAFEAPFYGENVQSMLKLGRSQGVAMAAVLIHGADVFEYAPRKIKSAITGQGAASKEQVASILKNILKLDALPSNLDATDGLAVALCHYYQRSNHLGSSPKTNWESFIKKNPDRVIDPSKKR